MGDERIKKMWGGRFSSKSSSIIDEINASIYFDYRLVEYDLKGSIAHAKMLVACKIIDKSDGRLIVNGLRQILSEVQEGKLKLRVEMEDIHTHIEARLQELIGDAAGKLHTARSRNDQVALDFKMWVRDALKEVRTLIMKLEKSIVGFASKHVDTIMPAFTHLQIAQPVTLGHHLLAYFEMFYRDSQRLQEILKRSGESPLGACAVAGTSYPIDRDATARALGFKKPTSNSIDSVSDRDFAIEYLAAISLCSVHLSRLAEELILWSSQQFDFIKLADSLATGSSIMPQKKNPDAAELVRGKTGRIIGSLNSLLIMMKALPLAYFKDMQEDKEPTFEAHDNIVLCLKTMTELIDNIEVNRDKMHEAAQTGYSTATDLADWLVQNVNIPFRTAHFITGKIVNLAENKKCRLGELDLSEMQRIEPAITEEVYDVLSVENSVKCKTSLGGTAPSNIRRMLKKYRAVLVEISK